VLIYPLLASTLVAGFPITNFSKVIPTAAIWKSEVSGHVEDDFVRSPEHVVY